MSITWILVADAARARLFESSAHDETLRPVGSYINSEARLSGRQLTRGRLPTVNESMGDLRHSMEPHADLREKHAARFARELAAVLERGRTSHSYDRLILVAPSKFLGALHGCFDKALHERVAGELRRDITTLSPARIRERLATLLDADVHGSVLA